MVSLYLFVNLFFLPFLVKALTQDDRDKVTSCLLLYRHRKYQDKKNFSKMLERLGKVVDHAEQKISMFSLVNCFDNISVKEAKDMYYKFNQNGYIDSMLEQNKKLLNIENFENVDYETYAIKLEKFTPIFNEVYKETKKSHSFKIPQFAKNNILGFFSKDVAIIITISILCIIISICLYCYKTKKLTEEYDKELEEIDKRNTDDYVKSKME